jgi:hypothetical protein
MNSEVTPVILVHLNQNDFLRNRITMLTQAHPGAAVTVHKTIDGTKIIEGEVVEEGVVS